VNSANARTCYVCVSPLTALASAADAAPSTGRRYASFPDEIGAGAETEMDTGAAIAHDLLKSLQKKSKPRRAPLPKAVEVPITNQVDEVPEVAAVLAPPAVVEEAVAVPPPVAIREAVAPQGARAAEESIPAIQVPVAAKVEEPDMKPDWDWSVTAEEAAPMDSVEEERETILASATLDAEGALAPAAALHEAPVEAILEAELVPASVAAAQATTAEPAPSALHANAPAAEPPRVPLSRTETAPLEKSASTWGKAKPTVIASEDWRRELSSRVEAYRSRTGSVEEEGPQSDLEFSQPEPLQAEEPSMADVPEEPPSPRASLRTAARQRPETMEIVALQPEFDFALGETDEHPHAPLVPVADLSERRAAGLLDGAFLVAAFLAFLVCFTSLGPGKITFGKMEFAILGMTFFLFYVQYFALFTIFGGASPGMMIRGLRVVRFDGSAPDSQQLVRRSFGYLVSAASLLLGFVWSLWDEDQLTWHDRMSHTYLTHAAPQSTSE